MNPTHALATWLHSLVAGGPEWLQGLAIMAGICLALSGIVLVALPLAWLATRRR